MAAERLVQDTQKALSLLLGRGAAGASTEAPRTWNALGARARSLGLQDLAERCERLAGTLNERGALAFEASPELADAALAVHDRVEGLAGALTLWTVEAQLNGGQGAEPRCLEP